MFDELRAIQASFGYLPTDQLHQLSRKLKIPVSQIHAVASFYPHFYLKPPPKVDVRVCADMSCHLRGATQVRKSLDQAFAGQGQDAITIRDVSCLGRCDTAPALSINDRIYSGGTPQQVLDLVRATTEGKPLPSSHHEHHHRQRLTTDPYSGVSTYKAVRRLQFADLPKTISGKIRRVELRRRELARTDLSLRADLEYWVEDFSDLE